MDDTTSEKRERFQNNNLLQAWLVLTLALIFGISLAGVQAALGPKIEANKIKETMEKVPEVVLGLEAAQKLAASGETLNIQSRVIEVSKKNKKKFYTVYEARFKDNTVAGWVAKAGGQGYADKIELLVGIDALAENITGLFILDQKETPGLGNKISDTAWRNQFIDKPATNPLVVVKDKSQGASNIDAISGATISSVSVCGIINQTVSDIRPELTSTKKD
ncbi:FMN-binding protein [Desulfocicer niacini]